MARFEQGVGFTGTRDLTPNEHWIIERELDALPTDSIIITGACIGVDAYVAQYAHNKGMHVHTIVPAERRLVDPDWKDHCASYTLMPEGTTYRDRNLVIVQMAGRGIVGIPRYPKRHGRSTRSGTWQTIRFAEDRARDVRVVVLTEAQRP